MTPTPTLSKAMRRHPFVALACAAALSCLAHKAVDHGRCVAPTTDESFAIQLHDGIELERTVPTNLLIGGHVSVRVAYPDLGDDPMLVKHMDDGLSLTVTDSEGFRLFHDSDLERGPCVLVRGDALSHASWLTLKRDRAVDYTHVCSREVLVSVTDLDDIIVRSTWSGLDRHDAPPVLIVTPMDAR